ncbi:MAG: co-chaperone GroES [Deltaproteobacteria bacterium]|nr:MAG: co-chaperone GroES [Deltaproteobacteria bacterium]
MARHVQPLGPRVLVRIVRDSNRSDAGLYLPPGAREATAQALLGEVVEVARTLPKTPDPIEVAAEDDEVEGKADLGENVSGIPLGARVLFLKDRAISLPWDDDLRILEVRHVLAIVDLVPEDELQ